MYFDVAITTLVLMCNIWQVQSAHIVLNTILPELCFHFINGSGPKVQAYKNV